MNKKFEAVPIEEWKTPESWEFNNLDDPEDFFAVGPNEIMKVIWGKHHLDGITHVLVPIEEPDQWVSPVTDEQIELAWGNADFGDQPKREVIYDTLCKFAMGYGTGKFARMITEELGLSGGENHGRERLTEKGLKFILTHPSKRY